MEGGGREILEGPEELGPDSKDTGTLGRQPTGFGGIFQGGGADGSTIWVRYVGDDPPHEKGPIFFFRIVSPGGLRGYIQSDGWMGVGSTHIWRHQWRRQGLRK